MIRYRFQLLIQFLTMLLFSSSTEAQEWLCNKPSCSLKDFCEYRNDNGSIDDLLYADQHCTWASREGGIKGYIVGGCSSGELCWASERIDEVTASYLVPLKEKKEESFNNLEDAADILTSFTDKLSSSSSDSIQLLKDIEDHVPKRKVWSEQVANAIASHSPDFNKICDSSYYSIIKNEIDNMDNVVPLDGTLKDLENDLIKRIDLLVDEIDKLSSAIDKEVIPQHAIKIIGITSDIRNKLISKKDILLNFSKMRDAYVSQIKKTWENMLLQVANLNIVCNMNDQLRNTIFGDIYYSDIKYQIDRINKKITKYIDTDNCPLIAYRNTHIMKTILDDLDNQFDSLPVNDYLKGKIFNVIQAGWDKYNLKKRRIEESIQNKLDFYAGERNFMLEYMKAQLSTPLSQECQSLAENVVQAKISIESEIAYQEFVEKCYSK